MAKLQLNMDKLIEFGINTVNGSGVFISKVASLAVTGSRVLVSGVGYIDGQVAAAASWVIGTDISKLSLEELHGIAHRAGFNHFGEVVAWFSRAMSTTEPQDAHALVREWVKFTRRWKQITGDKFPRDLELSLSDQQVLIQMMGILWGLPEDQRLEALIKGTKRALKETNLSKKERKELEKRLLG
jgi:hypothetical protein